MENVVSLRQHAQQADLIGELLELHFNQSALTGKFQVQPLPCTNTMQETPL
jgi:hypothetical protein